MAKNNTKKPRMYDPWGYRDQDYYESSENQFEIELNELFASAKYDDTDKKIHFFNNDGDEISESSIDTTEFASGIIDDAYYDSATKELVIVFDNGTEVRINMAEIIDENEFGDGLQVDSSGIVSVKIDAASEPYLIVSSDGIKLSGIEALIEAEKQRATSAETALDNKIDQETVDRIADVDAEEARALSAETVLQAAIDAEEQRAKDAEQVLDGRINTEIADRIADVNAEEARALSAETALQTAIDQEAADRAADIDEEEARAKEAEQALQDAIDAEKTRATQTEGQLNHRIDLVNDELDSEESRAQAAEQELRLLITTEIADRKADVDEEEARAKAAEEALQNAIEAEEARATSAETALQAAIEAESQRAQNAEQVLDEKIDAEEARATSAETELQDAIEAESQRAQNAEETLDEKIDAEEARATSAETALLDAIDELGVNKFDDVEYDSSAKTINFYAEGDLVKNLDATPFIKDGMIDEVYIDHETEELVIVWNTEAGKQETRISLKEIFNPEDYYTKDDVDAIETSLDEKISALRTSLNNEVTRATAKEEELENNDIASGSIASDATVSITKNNGDVITFTSAEQINLEAGEF